MQQVKCWMMHAFILLCWDHAHVVAAVAAKASKTACAASYHMQGSNVAISAIALRRVAAARAAHSALDNFQIRMLLLLQSQRMLPQQLHPVFRPPGCPSALLLLLLLLLSRRMHPIAALFGVACAM
jgi:hypothetical protein